MFQKNQPCGQQQNTGQTNSHRRRSQIQKPGSSVSAQFIHPPCHDCKNRNRIIETVVDHQRQHKRKKRIPCLLHQPGKQKKSKKFIRHIIYKHDLPVRLKKTSRRHQKDTADKSHIRFHLILEQKIITQDAGGQYADHHVRDQNIYHGDLRQQTSDQNVWAKISVIREFISIAPAAKPQKIRKNRFLRETCIPQRLRKRCMLTHPVRIGTEHRSFRYKQIDQNKKQGRQ